MILFIIVFGHDPKFFLDLTFSNIGECAVLNTADIIVHRKYEHDFISKQLTLANEKAAHYANQQ